MNRFTRIAAVVGVAGASLAGIAGAAFAAPNDSPCRPADPSETRLLYSNDNAVQRELPTVYTDGGKHYVGACGGSGTTMSYIQVNELAPAVSGTDSILEGQTGNQTLDSKFWGDGTQSYGPANVFLQGKGQPAGTNGCAPAGSTELGHANGNNIQRELPTVYTDGGNHFVGICGGGGRLQVNELKNPSITIVPLP